MSFVNALKNVSIEKQTENGALAYSTTNSKVLDLYAVIGSLRTREPEDIVTMFNEAFSENKELAAKLVLYARDIRNGGCGERRTGRILLKALANKWPELVNINLQNFADAGRYDDLFWLFGTECQPAVKRFIKSRINEDIATLKDGGYPSLLGKWMPSINASSSDARGLAVYFKNVLEMTPKEYRKTLSALREKLDVVERKMSANEWDDIDFEKVPSYAMKEYKNAFKKHSPEKWEEYVESLNKGEAKINSSVLFPYDIIDDVSCGRNELSDAQWKALPDYFGGKERNIIALVDTSGSMCSRWTNDCPFNSAIGLGIYCAQHNKGEYHNVLMTFSRDPHIHVLKEGCTITEAYRDVNTGDCANTNLDKALAKILQLSVRADEAPDAVLVLSDMEIDSFFHETEPETSRGWVGSRIDYKKNGLSIIEEYRKAFSDAGLKMPKIIFWNLEARQNTYLATPNDPDARYISGVSAGLFLHLDDTLFLEAYPAMVSVLNKYELTFPG